MTEGRLIVWGASGHAACVVDLARACGWSVVACVDDVSAKPANDVLGVPVVRRTPADGAADAFVVAVGDPAGRQACVEKTPAGWRPVSLIHPTAVVGGESTLGEGAVVLPNGVIGPRAEIGPFVSLGSGCVVEHDAVLGAFVSVGPGAVLAGWSRAGDGADIGAGASVRDRIAIGRGARVGMGAAVVADVAAGDTVAGVPARPLSAEAGR